MVAVAQLVESRIVIPVVVGSSPISHPTLYIVETKVHKGPLSFIKGNKVLCIFVSRAFYSIFV